MRILAVAERFVPAPGGSEISLHAVLKGLHAAGHEVAIHTSAAPPGAPSAAAMPRPADPWLVRIAASRFDADGFRDVLARFRPDRVLTQMDWAHLAGPVAVEACIPVCFFSCVGDVCGALDGIVFNSAWCERSLAGYGFLAGKGRHVLHPPIERAAVVAVRPRPAEVVMVNPIRAKGGELFARLAASMPDIPFLAVTGWYDPAEDGIDLALPNVTLLPNQSDMRPVYGRARVLMVPSLFPEAFGRVAREGVLNGLPVIASTRGGLPEATLGAALHLDPEDEPAWREMLRRLWDSQKAANDLAARARVAAHRYREADEMAAFVAFVEGLERQGTYPDLEQPFHNLEWLSSRRAGETSQAND